LEAAETICPGEGLEQGEILDLLARLVDKSLVTVTADRGRYGMLETIRQYAKEKSIEAGMEEWIIQKHLDYFTNLAETGAEKIRGPEQLAWIKWFDAEHDNLASAMRKSLNYSPWIGKGVELVCYVFSYWFLISDFIQIRYWLEVAISQSACLGRTPTRARILLNAGMCAGHGLNWLKPNEVRRTLVKEALEIWQGHGPAFTFEMAQCWLFLGYIQKHHFNDDKGIDSVRKSIEIFKKLEAYWWHAWALNRLTALIRDMSDFQVICSMLEEEAALWKKAGDRWGQAIVLFDRGLLEMDHGDFGEAEKYLLESRKMFNEVGRVGYISRVLVQLGDATRGLKKYTQAEAYYNECVTLAPMSGMFFPELASYAGLGYVALHKGDDQAAENYFYQSLKLAQQCNHKINLTFKLMCFACLSAFRENSIIAARLFGAFHANIEALQDRQYPDDQLIVAIDKVEINYYLRLCRAQVDKATFDQAFGAGRRLSLDEAIDEIFQANKERMLLEP